MNNSSRDIRYTLVEWTGGQESAERLSGHILRSEGYESVDPSQPLGGPDGTKDLKCNKSGIEFIGGCYFPRGQMTFTKIKKKFLNDLDGVKKNNVNGFIFITNQEITVTQRRQLEMLAIHPTVIFHLERIIDILDRPINYAFRSKFLEIPITHEENISVMALNNELLSEIKELRQYLPLLANAYMQNKDQKVNAVADDKSILLERKTVDINVNKGDVYFADLGDGVGAEQVGTRPVVIVSNYINNRYSPTVTIVPVTGQITEAKLPTHVELGLLINPERESVALAEQIKTISKKRLIRFITKLDENLIDDIDDSISIQMQLVDF